MGEQHPLSLTVCRSFRQIGDHYRCRLFRVKRVRLLLFLSRLVGIIRGVGLRCCFEALRAIGKLSMSSGWPAMQATGLRR